MPKIDRIAEPWGTRTPYGPGQDWPVRVDSFLCPDVASLCAVSAAQVLARGAGMDLSGCDALFIACTQLPTLAALPHLRKRLGLPVWSANSATAWMLARQGMMAA